MKKKNFTTEDNYKENVLKRMIILCWILLGVCFAIKIFGGNFFGIIADNKAYMDICSFIDKYLYYISRYAVYQFGTYFYMMAIIQNYRPNKRQLILLLVVTTISFIIKSLYPIIGLIFDIAICEILLPFYISRSVKRTAVGFALINVFQIISLFVKNLGLFKILDTSFIIGLIYLFDYYIMLILYYLYSNLIKERKDMGLFGLGWLKDEVEKLKALLAVTTDEEQKKVLTEVIENLEKKAK